MAEYDVDLFVIGGGSGGVRAARIAAGYGAKVMVAEEYRMGGTCVIRGCVPKKLFVIGSHVRHAIEDAAGFGWTIPQATFDWPTLIANKDKEIARLEAAYTTEFTEQELKDLVAFYKTPLGVKLLNNEPRAIQASMAFMNQWAQQFAEVINAAFRTEMKKRGKEI